MARELKDLTSIWDNVKERVGILADLEQDGDAITHDIMALSHRTFITPFDREDISLLAHSLDEIADHIHSVADMLYLYNIECPTDKIKELSNVLLQAVIEVEGAVSSISGNIDQKALLKRCVEINRLENLGDSVSRAALAELFLDPSDTIYVVKWRDIYANMESAIDGCEAVAGVLEGVGIKYA